VEKRNSLSGFEYVLLSNTSAIVCTSTRCDCATGWLAWLASSFYTRACWTHRDRRRLRCGALAKHSLVSTSYLPHIYCMRVPKTNERSCAMFRAGTCLCCMHT